MRVWEESVLVVSFVSGCWEKLEVYVEINRGIPYFVTCIEHTAELPRLRQRTRAVSSSLRRRKPGASRSFQCVACHPAVAATELASGAGEGGSLLNRAYRQPPTPSWHH